MTTAGARLASLAGASGTAGALLLLIGAGGTAGAALVNYSGLPSATAAEHLMTDRPPPDTGGTWVGPQRRYRPKDEDAALLIFGLI
jgi:hypothetical protein